MLLMMGLVTWWRRDRGRWCRRRWGVRKMRLVCIRWRGKGCSSSSSSGRRFGCRAEKDGA